MLGPATGCSSSADGVTSVKEAAGRGAGVEDADVSAGSEADSLGGDNDASILT